MLPPSPGKEKFSVPARDQTHGCPVRPTVTTLSELAAFQKCSNEKESIGFRLSYPVSKNVGRKKASF
jgi:hypothetical protein